MNLPATRTLSRLVIGCLVFTACHSTATQLPAPTAFARSPYRQPAETLALSSPDQEAVYRAVLRFYRPTRGHVRWLDRTLLTDAPGQSAATMERPLALQLIAEVDPSRFCLEEVRSTCPGRVGGVLRLSQVYAEASGQARVVVDFKGEAGPYAPGTAYSGLEVFVLDRHEPDWQIRAHTPAGS
jgi:hypothetical protein